MAGNDTRSKEFGERAVALHADAFIMDAHVDTLSEMVDRDYDLGSAPPDAHLSWEKIATGGLGAQLFQRIEGDYFTILGLPLLPLLNYLRDRGMLLA